MTRFTAVILCVVVLALSLPSAAEQSPEEYIRTLGQETVEVLRNGQLTFDEREQEFRRLLTKGFDVETVSRFVLGRYWRTATEAQRAEFQQLFQDFVIKYYANRFGQYSGENFTVKDSRTQDDTAFVSTIIERNAKPLARVDWRLHRAEGSYKIVDVVVEGVSMALTHRSEFGSVIQNGGGNVDVLLDALRKRIAAAQH